jgi:TonB family protein
MGMSARTSIVTLLFAPLLGAQAPATAENDTPVVVRFVAPAYPKAAKDARIAGVTTTQVFVDRDGVVTSTKTIVAHRVFEDYVLEALKQWRFKATGQVQTLRISCRFELMPECEDGNKSPTASETYVSAELPTVVHIKTRLPCFESFAARPQR